MREREWDNRTEVHRFVGDSTIVDDIWLTLEAAGASSSISSTAAAAAAAGVVTADCWVVAGSIDYVYLDLGHCVAQSLHLLLLLLWQRWRRLCHAESDPAASQLGYCFRDRSITARRPRRDCVALWGQRIDTGGTGDVNVLTTGNHWNRCDDK